MQEMIGSPSASIFFKRPQKMNRNERRETFQLLHFCASLAKIVTKLVFQFPSEKNGNKQLNMDEFGRFFYRMFISA